MITTKHLNFFGIFLLSLLSIGFISCSDDNDDSADPERTVTLNMLNEVNGGTELGNSDVYIDRVHNFVGSYCSIISLGNKNGLGGLPTPVLQGMTNQAAVVPGNAYQVFRNVAVRRFPSGHLALNISADYYDVYVVSHIKKDETLTGAVVKFALKDIPDYKLPENNSSIGIIPYGKELTIELSSSDFEFEYDRRYNSYDDIEFQKKGNKLILSAKVYSGEHNFGIFIRIKDSYTYVRAEAGLPY